MLERDGCGTRRPADRLVRRIDPVDRARRRPDDGIDDDAREQHDVIDVIDVIGVDDIDLIDLAVAASRSNDRPRA